MKLAYLVANFMASFCLRQNFHHPRSAAFGLYHHSPFHRHSQTYLKGNEQRTGMACSWLLGCRSLRLPHNQTVPLGLSR